MSAADILLIGVAAFFAGAMNAVAGGGTFFSFPALLAIGVPPVVANASNAVALWPASLSSAWAYRDVLRQFRPALPALTWVAFAGGLAGGLLLLAAQDRLFSRLIPWLLGLATLLFALSGPLSRGLSRRSGGTAPAPGNSIGGLIFQAAVSIYGGFFGAGMGIMMLASLSIATGGDYHRLNAIKNALSIIIALIAIVVFTAGGAISWFHAIVMLPGAGLGGYLGVHAARRLPQVWLRTAVVAVGLFLAAYYFFTA